MEVRYADPRFRRVAEGTGQLPGLPSTVAFEYCGLIRWLEGVTDKRDLLAMTFLDTRPPDSSRPDHWRFRLIEGFSVTCRIQNDIATVMSLQQE